MASKAPSIQPSSTRKGNKQHKTIHKPNPIHISPFPPFSLSIADSEVPTSKSTSLASKRQPLHPTYYYHQRKQPFTPPPPSNIPSIEYLPTGALILHRILPNNPPPTPTQILFNIASQNRDRKANLSINADGNPTAHRFRLTDLLKPLRCWDGHSNHSGTTIDPEATPPKRPVIGHPTDFRVI